MSDSFDLRRPRTPTSLLLFHCLFADYGICGHREYSFDLPSYLELGDLYAICAIDDSCRPERMVSGVLIKTNIGYEKPGFLDGAEAVFNAIPELRATLHPHISLLPAPVDAGSLRPLTESQALHVFKELWSEHVASQVLAKRLSNR